MTQSAIYSKTALDTGMQRQDKTYVASSKLSVRIPIVLPMQKKIRLFSVANTKTKTQLKLICHVFHFAYIRFSKISLFGMVLKRLKLPKLFKWCGTNLFLHTSIWVSEGGQEFENFSKNAAFIISIGKNQISPLLAHP